MTEGLKASDLIASIREKADVAQSWVDDLEGRLGRAEDQREVYRAALREIRDFPTMTREAEEMSRIAQEALDA